jgi:hypothetical protein
VWLGECRHGRLEAQKKAMSHDRTLEWVVAHEELLLKSEGRVAAGKERLKSGGTEGAVLTKTTLFRIIPTEACSAGNWS